MGVLVVADQQRQLTHASAAAVTAEQGALNTDNWRVTLDVGTHASQSLSAGKWRLQAYVVSVSKGFWVVFVDAEAAPVGVLGVVPQVAQNALNLPAVSNIKQRSGCKVRA